MLHQCCQRSLGILCVCFVPGLLQHCHTHQETEAIQKNEGCGAAGLEAGPLSGLVCCGLVCCGGLVCLVCCGGLVCCSGKHTRNNCSDFQSCTFLLLLFWLGKLPLAVAFGWPAFRWRLGLLDLLEDFFWASSKLFQFAGCTQCVLEGNWRALLCSSNFSSDPLAPRAQFGREFATPSNIFQFCCLARSQAACH